LPLRKFGSTLVEINRNELNYRRRHRTNNFNYRETMWINRIIFRNHKILGKMFNFHPLGNGKTRFKRSIQSSIEINLTDVKGSHFYTCIIGKNGSGKSILLRSIIHSLNTLADKYIQNPALEYFSYHSKPDKAIQAWQKYKLEPQLFAINVLKELEIIISDTESKTNDSNLNSVDDINSGSQSAAEILETPPLLLSDIEETLRRYLDETIVIHVTNAKYDKPIRHPNPNFRSFASDDSVSSSAYLMAKSLLIENCTVQFENVIGDILNCSKVKIEFEVSSFYGLKLNRVFEIINELKTFDFLEKNGSSFFIISNEIQNTSFFADMFLTSTEDFTNVVNLIKNSAMLAKIIEYFNGIGQSANLNHFGSTFCFHISTGIVCNYVDLCVLGIFQQLGILSLQCKINGVVFNNLSSGEKEQIRLATYLSAGIYHKNKVHKQLLILIDEPENSLHPEWQYSFCLKLDKLLNLFEYKNAQIILTTHSPLLLMGLHGAGLNYHALSANRNENHSFDVVGDINAYCAEEVLLDIFGVRYRKQEIFDAVKKYLLENEGNLEPANPDPNDPINDSITIEETQTKLRKVALEILKGDLS
jgi:predicted ATP-dependent endonuclease of OLD family